ncbi:thioredoxin family protein [Natronocalculus amylovorans]|uniref:Thioredoxin family protein n=1 Tax=Natronocalculus amylovorans TaxID=2917812 RepID=A0AAE3K9F5_9EURY|nr:thioredoxin family protein [Natronocalculus amylovorans]MCL9818021.1 thioredoxin family protein [Natronocalculus amylovorans]NUE03987.1 thioredoxin family protein [Halorubraceae archaeon YAN]
MSDTGSKRQQPVKLADEAAVDEFIQSHSIALLELYTTGCGICESMEPVIGNVAKETPAAVGVVNARSDPTLIDRFTVRSVPKFVLFVDRETVAERAEGFIPGADLSEWIVREAEKTSDST